MGTALRSAWDLGNVWVWSESLRIWMPFFCVCFSSYLGSTADCVSLDTTLFLGFLFCVVSKPGSEKSTKVTISQGFTQPGTDRPDTHPGILKASLASFCNNRADTPDCSGCSSTKKACDLTPGDCLPRGAQSEPEGFLHIPGLLEH